MRSPAGRAMACIKLLSLPPPRGRHWPVEGIQQCVVCVLSSCCSLSVARRFFVLRAGLLVSLYRASRARSLGFCRIIFAGPCGCCSVDLVTWGVGSNRGGGLCLPWMWIMRCVHVSVRQACNGCVSGSAASALEGRNLEVCSSLCPWWFLLGRLWHRGRRITGLLVRRVCVKHLVLALG